MIWYVSSIKEVKNVSEIFWVFIRKTDQFFLLLAKAAVATDLEKGRFFQNTLVCVKGGLIFSH
jgi:hypothetical protein